MSGLLRNLVCLALLVTASAVHARDFGEQAQNTIPWTSERGYSIHIDNDLFSGAHRDQDYSWGLGFTYASPRPGPLLSPLHSVRNRFDTWLTTEDSAGRGWAPDQQATQIGLIAMTPSTLRESEPLPGDRPFASLLFATSSQTRVHDSGRSARFSSLTVGMLGLDLAGNLQRGVHALVQNEPPLGWGHQISAGGEPTARYVEARQWLLDGEAAQGGDQPEVKFTLAGSAGYITEGSLALSARWGRIQSPWWNFAPELSDYMAAPVAPVARFSSHNPAEVFAFAGIRLKARAYNALLQGQFRHSDVRVQGDDLAHFHAEAWLGFATTWSDVRITYAIRYASEEMRTEPGARSLIWAGINFDRSM